MAGSSVGLGAGIVALAVWILISGLDDFFIDLAWAWQWWRKRTPPRTLPGSAGKEKRLAILVPLWREARVVRGMVEHNLASIRYGSYDIWLGVYPNDAQTRKEAEALAARFPNVQVSVCPHDGPTSKADCLNWIYQRLLVAEDGGGVRCDVVLTHDAEDLIHPDSLAWVNACADEFDMVQIPVLPLATPAWEIVHGVYCDEFAEFQIKELPVRQALGGFLPSCGVGTAFTRRTLDRLAAAHANRVFEPRCLTEDYENGFRVHRLGGKQRFVPVESGVATREYFPRTFGAAILQRTRWLTGIGLQSWELHGWRDTLRQGYWFWRDRKGIGGSLVSPLANLIFFEAVAAWSAGRHSWFDLAIDAHPWLGPACAATLALQCVHLAIRMCCSARVYGWRFAALAPLRVPASNLINFLAALGALGQYARAKLARQPLVWLKTDHLYPTREALMSHKRRLGEILVGSLYVSAADLEAALRTQPAGVRLGEHLVSLGKITEDDLYEALSLQQNLEVTTRRRLAPRREATRALPAAVARRWRVLPFQVKEGKLYVTSPELPSDEMYVALAIHTRLEIRFHLIAPTEFEALEREYLPSP